VTPAPAGGTVNATVSMLNTDPLVGTSAIGGSDGGAKATAAAAFSIANGYPVSVGHKPTSTDPADVYAGVLVVPGGRAC
jgi:hypothetical protein